MEGMMPTDSFWDGVAESIKNASGNIVVVAVLVGAILFFLVKYYMPLRQEDRRQEREMQQKTFELRAKQQQDSADIQRENIESRAREIEILQAVQTTMDAVSAVLRDVSANQQVLIARINDSKAHSQGIATTQVEIKENLVYVRDMVDDIHDAIFKPTVAD